MIIDSEISRMEKYKIERSNIFYYGDYKSMVCTFTITHNETQEKFVYKNVYLAEDNTEAFLVFPSTNEEVFINREKKKYYIRKKEYSLCKN